MSNIRIDTDLMNQYANRLRDINEVICRLDHHIHQLYLKVGWCDLWTLFQADLSTAWSWKIDRCARYLDDTAYAFWNLEEKLRGYNVLKFNKRDKAGAEEILWNCIDGFTRDNFVWARTILKGLKGVGKLVGGAVTIWTPGGAASVISGINDIATYFMDMSDYGEGNFSHIGQNDFLKTFGEETIGTFVGKETGGKVFTTGIDAINLLSSIESFSSSLDKVTSYVPNAFPEDSLSQFIDIEKVAYNAVKAGSSTVTSITEVCSSVLDVFNIDTSIPDVKSSIKNYYNENIGPAIPIGVPINRFK